MPYPMNMFYNHGIRQLFKSEVFGVLERFKLLNACDRRMHTSALKYKYVNNRRGEKFSKIRKSTNEVSDHSEDNILEENDADVEAEYETYVKRTFRVPDMGHSVFIIQPHVKWGAKKKRNTTPDLQLQEAVALINTLPGWSVVEKTTVSLLSFNKKTVFGSGKLETFKKTMEKNENISAVFLSIDLLKGYQHQALETIFGVPVYDRYNIVIQIFREHAITKEARLQVQMAEIPYIWSKLKYSDELKGNSFLEVRQMVLRTKEAKLRKELLKLREHRKLLRVKRIKHEFPIVAVVGYTNSGKTSLIKTLTGEESMEPKNQLFATLDITLHSGFLPSKLQVLYVDTIGFISDIPTALIESFVATLEDAMFADVILHVMDISHPDLESQVDEVSHTLKELNLPDSVRNNIVIAGNKIDLVTKEKCQEVKDRYNEENIVFISAEKQIGTDVLKQKIEEAVLKATGRSVMVIRVPSGGEEFNWLYRECSVSDVIADSKDPQYVFMKTIISKTKLAQFKHCFITNYKQV